LIVYIIDCVVKIPDFKVPVNFILKNSDMYVGKWDILLTGVEISGGPRLLNFQKDSLGSNVDIPPDS
jgi:hypothetical protein